VTWRGRPQAGADRPTRGALKDLVDATRCEKAAGLLLRALSAEGRHAEALIEFENAGGRWPKSWVADPYTRAGRWFTTGDLRAETAADVPAAAQLTSFVGRDDELRRITKTARRRRLVTSPDRADRQDPARGVGAGREQHLFFVDLAPLRTGNESPGGIRRARPARIRPAADHRAGGRAARHRSRLVAGAGRPPDPARAGQLRAHHRRRRRLARGCSPAARTCGSWPQPARRWASPGEALYRAELSFPVAGTDLLDTLGYPAVRLFVDRAVPSGRTSSRIPTNIEAVRAHLRGADGLPLAIELAAARLRSLPLEQIAGRLSAPLAGSLRNGARSIDSGCCPAATDQGGPGTRPCMPCAVELGSADRVRTAARRAG